MATGLALELKTHPSYQPEKVAWFFDGRGWSVEFTTVGRAGLVVVDLDTPVECIDGRFGNIQGSKKHGPKIPGGLNAIAALKTGSGITGFNAAAKEAKGLGFRAGTHGHCGFFELWQKGELSAARYPLTFPEFSVTRFGLSRWIELMQRFWGGKHFHLPGEHVEEMLVFNPFIGLTPVASSERFGYDHWVMQRLGTSPRRAMSLVAEAVEKLKPDAMKLELIVP